MSSQEFRAVATLVGTAIGAGIFGIPYAVSKIGFWPGMIYLLFLGGMVLLLNLIYGEIILRTRGDHQLIGYAQIYLGERGKKLALASIFLGLYGALLAYLIQIGEFLALLFRFSHPSFFSFLFFGLGSLAIWRGLRLVSKLEVLISLLLAGSILLFAIAGAPEMRGENFVGMNLTQVFLPYGVILFALSGAAVIPEMEEILRKERGQLKKAILVGSLLPILVYFLFTSVVVGISGPLTSEDAIAGLVNFLPAWIVSFGALLGILTMASSYLILGFVLREVWFRDLGFSQNQAFLLAVFPSMLLFLFGAKSFINVLGITGALSGGLTGILVLAMLGKAQKQGQKKPAYSLRVSSVTLGILLAVLILGLLSPFLIERNLFT